MWHVWLIQVLEIGSFDGVYICYVVGAFSTVKYSVGCTFGSVCSVDPADFCFVVDRVSQNGDVRFPFCVFLSLLIFCAYLFDMFRDYHEVRFLFSCCVVF